MTIDVRLQRLVDEAEIRRVVCQYARAVDRCDWELLRSCYHPGAIDDHGAFHGTVDELIGLLELEEWESTDHFVANQLVDFEEDGDVAWVETYVYALHRSRTARDEPLIDAIGNGRFFDRFERRDGEWRIAHRRVVFGAGRVDQVANLDHAFLPRGGFGSRNRSDPTYRRTVERG